MKSFIIFSFVLIFQIVGCSGGDPSKGIPAVKKPEASSITNYVFILTKNGSEKVYTFAQEYSEVNGTAKTVFKLTEGRASSEVVLRADAAEAYLDRSIPISAGIPANWAPLEVLYLSCHLGFQQKDAYAVVVIDICAERIVGVEARVELDSRPAFDVDRGFVAKSIFLTPQDTEVKKKGTAVWDRYSALLQDLANSIADGEITPEMQFNIWQRAMSEMSK